MQVSVRVADLAIEIIKHLKEGGLPDEEIFLYIEDKYLSPEVVHELHSKSWVLSKFDFAGDPHNYTVLEFVPEVSSNDGDTNSH